MVGSLILRNILAVYDYADERGAALKVAALFEESTASSQSSNGSAREEHFLNLEAPRMLLSLGDASDTSARAFSASATSFASADGHSRASLPQLHVEHASLSPLAGALLKARALLLDRKWQEASLAYRKLLAKQHELAGTLSALGLQSADVLCQLGLALLNQVPSRCSFQIGDV